MKRAAANAFVLATATALSGCVIVLPPQEETVVGRASSREIPDSVSHPWQDPFWGACTLTAQYMSTEGAIQAGYFNRYSLNNKSLPQDVRETFQAALRSEQVVVNGKLLCGPINPYVDRSHGSQFLPQIGRGQRINGQLHRKEGRREPMASIPGWSCDYVYYTYQNGQSGPAANFSKDAQPKGDIAGPALVPQINALLPRG